MSPSITVVGAPALAARLASVPSPLADARVVVVGGPVDERVAHAAQAIGRGAHVFLQWPPADAARAAEALAGRAEEAGVEVGVARPLGARALAGVPPGWAARLVTLTSWRGRAGRWRAPAGPGCWPAPSTCAPPSPTPATRAAWTPWPSGTGTRCGPWP